MIATVFVVTANGALPLASVSADNGTPSFYVPDAPVTRSSTLRVIVNTNTIGLVNETIVANDLTISDGHLSGSPYVGPLWTLASGPDGVRTIYGQIQYGDGSWSSIFEASVNLLTDYGSAMYTDLDPESVSTVIELSGDHQWHELASTPNERFEAAAPNEGSMSFWSSFWNINFWRTSGAFTPGTYTLGGYDDQGNCVGNCADIWTTTGTTCGGVKSGTFTINSLTFTDSGDDVVSADIDFRLVCRIDMVMAGSVRYGSDGAIRALNQSSDTLSFGGVDEGKTSDLPVTITNIGSADVGLGNADITDAASYSDPDDYTIANDTCSGKTLSAGQDCSVDLEFAPGAPGQANAVLDIPDDTSRLSREVVLLGSGANLPSGLTVIQSGSLTAPGPVSVSAVLTPGAGSNCSVQLAIDGFPDFYPDHITWTGSSDSDSTTKTATFEAPPGNYSATASFTACGGQQGATTSTSFTVTGDSTPPVGSFVVNDGSGVTNDANITLYLTATDPSGITKLAVGGAESPTDDNWVYFDPATSVPFSLDWDGVSDGTYYVRVRWRDGAANWSDPTVEEVALDRVAPVVSPPEQELVEGMSVVGGQVSVDVPWSGTDATTGVANYQLAQKTGTGAWVTVPATSGPAASDESSVEKSLAAGHAYTFRVRATDKASNTSGWATGPKVTIAKVQESSSRIKYSGKWKVIRAASDWGGAAKKATVAGASASFTFTGRSVAWVAPKGPGLGQARVYVDGVLVNTVDLFAASATPQYVVWSYNWQKAGKHSIKISVVGTTTRPAVEIDAIVTAA